MPILKDFRTSKQITLPSFKDSVVEIYSSILVGDMVKIDNAGKSEVEIIVNSLPLFIKNWNFTDESGKDLEINKENLGFLSSEDVQYLSEQIMLFNEESKKKPNT